MIHTEKQLQEISTGFTCDRCGKVVMKEDNIFEHQEGHHIKFTGGYDSIFGDGATVECDLCQSCLQMMIKDFCRITPSPY